MSQSVVTYRNGRIFDGVSLSDRHAIRFIDGVASDIGTELASADDGNTVDLDGDILCPGFVDLQVNGGGGVMLNDDPSVETIRKIAEAHHRLGVRHLLPTLITDTPQTTRAAIKAAIEATRQPVPHVAGLHLEGPHLSVARKGAHDASLIRPMETEDLDQLLEASKALPVLKVTIAPENVTEAQVSRMSQAGILVSLGHSDADFETCRRYIAAGARCVTHLFNAMSQLGNREPGVVGAALACGQASAGLIADAIHVHPETIRAAWAAKTGPGHIFLVSDAMAVAGTDLVSFELGGREIQRRNGQLTLQDGTLAGADLELTTAIRVMVEKVGIPLEAALAAATTVPAELVGLSAGIGPQSKASDILRLRADLSEAAWLG